MNRKVHVQFGGGIVEKRINCGSPFYLPYHESQPGDERPDGRLKEDGHTESYLHTHVVIAPTVPGLVQER